MKKPLFPGMQNIRADEALLFIRILKEDNNAEQITDFLYGIDECLTLQKSASMIDRFKGKKRYNRTSAKELIYERAAKIRINEKP